MVEIATPTATGATRLVEMLEQLGVELVFGLPGVHNLPIWKALSESGIRLVGRPARADRGVRRRRVRARDRPAGRRARHHRPRGGEYARRHRRGDGGRLPGSRDRHRRLDGAPTRRGLPGHAARDARSDRDVRPGHEGRSSGRARGRDPRSDARVRFGGAGGADRPGVPRRADQPAHATGRLRRETGARYRARRPSSRRRGWSARASCSRAPSVR